MADNNNQDLSSLNKLIKASSLVQVAQYFEEKHISKDEDAIIEKLEQIHDTVKKIESKSSQDGIKQDSFNNKVINASDISSKANLDQLKKIQEELTYKNVADKAKDEPVFKSFADNFKDLGQVFVNIKNALTSGHVLKSTAQGIASSVSPRYADKLEYIKAERNLGNVAPTDKELGKSYNERSGFLQRNIANENLLYKAQGKLTTAEFMKGGSKLSEQYSAEKIAIGEGLKRTDSRYRINDRPPSTEVEDEPSKVASYKYKKRHQFADTTNDINVDFSRKASTIPSMVNVNRSPIFKSEMDAESRSEEILATRKYQDTQLEDNTQQTEIFTDQLVTQKKILEAINNLPTTSDGSGIENVLDTVGNSVPTSNGGKTPGRLSKFFQKNKGSLIKGSIGVAGGMALEYGGDVLKESGHEDIGNAVSTAGSATQGASSGATIGSMIAGPVGAVIGGVAGGVVGAAEGFSDSFGEGGLELINKLRKEDAISYPMFGTTPTVEKWDVIEKLPPEQIQTLIATKEFEGKDLDHLNKILDEPSLLYSMPPITDIKQESTKVEPVKIEGNHTNIKEKYSSITPEVKAPTVGNSIYTESLNNSNLKNVGSQGGSVINAPTVVNNTTNGTTNNITKPQTRNTDITIVKYLESRFA